MSNKTHIAVHNQIMATSQIAGVCFIKHSDSSTVSDIKSIAQNKNKESQGMVYINSVLQEKGKFTSVSEQVAIKGGTDNRHYNGHSTIMIE